MSLRIGIFLCLCSVVLVLKGTWKAARSVAGAVITAVTAKMLVLHAHVSILLNHDYLQIQRILEVEVRVVAVMYRFSGIFKNLEESKFTGKF